MEVKKTGKKIVFEVTRKTAVKVAVMCALLFVAFFCGAMLTVPTAVEKGRKEGYLQALSDVSEATGITFEWDYLGDGRYQIFAFYEGVLVAEGYAEFHCEVVQRDRYGNLVSRTYHAGTLTTIGKNWIEDQLGDSPSTDPAKWIACSNTTDSASAAWTQLPNEITTDGLARAAGTYASTGDGTWNETKTFSVTGTNSTVCYGLHYASSGDNNLLCAENQGAGNRKNVNSGDTLKVTWQCTVT